MCSKYLRSLFLILSLVTISEQASAKSCKEFLRGRWEATKIFFKRSLWDARIPDKKKALIQSLSEKPLTDYFSDITNFNWEQAAKRAVEAPQSPNPLEFPEEIVKKFNDDFEEYLWTKSSPKFGLDRKSVESILKSWKAGAYKDYINRIYISQNFPQFQKTGDFMEHIFTDMLMKNAVEKDGKLLKLLKAHSPNDFTDLILVTPGLKVQSVLSKIKLKHIGLLGVGILYWLLRPLKQAANSQMDVVRASTMREGFKEYYRKHLHICDPNNEQSVNEYAKAHEDEVKRYSDIKWEDAKRLACFRAVMEGFWGSYHWDGQDIVRADLTSGRSNFIHYGIEKPFAIMAAINGAMAQIAILNAEKLKLKEKMESSEKYKKYLELKSKIISNLNLTKETWNKHAFQYTGLESLKAVISLNDKLIHLSDDEKILLNEQFEYELTYNKIIESQEKLKITAAGELAIWRMNEICFPELLNNPQSKEFRATYNKLKEQIGLEYVNDELNEQAAKILNTFMDPEKKSFKIDLSKIPVN